VSPDDVRTCEGTVEALRDSPLLGDIAEEILQTFAIEMREKANLLGPTAEEQLAYIEDIVLTENENKMSTLSKHELSKYGARRFDAFTNMLNTSSPFLLKDGRRVILTPTEELLTALTVHDAVAVDEALKRTQLTDETGALLTGLSLTKISKTPEFGGRAGLAESDADQNETSPVAKIVSKIADVNRPITIVFNNTVIDGVTSALHIGRRPRSKPDVVLNADGTPLNISIKDDSSDHYMSPGAVRASHWFKPALDMLMNATAPDPRIVKRDEDSYMIVVGPDENPVRREVVFEIPKWIAEIAAFGTGDNTVDLIVRGDLRAPPKETQRRLVWPNVNVYETFDEIPYEERPVCILRHGNDKCMWYNGIRLRNIRPQIVPAHRATAAIPLNVNLE
jgi:hypothetical protein